MINGFFCEKLFAGMCRRCIGEINDCVGGTDSRQGTVGIISIFGIKYVIHLFIYSFIHFKHYACN